MRLRGEVPARKSAAPSWPSDMPVMSALSRRQVFPRLGLCRSEQPLSMVRHASPYELLYGESGPPGENHAADVDAQLERTRDDLIGCAEGDPEREVACRGDRGDRDEDP